jgi:hypothetical protein
MRTSALLRSLVMVSAVSASMPEAHDHRLPFAEATAPQVAAAQAVSRDLCGDCVSFLYLHEDGLHPPFETHRFAGGGLALSTMDAPLPLVRSTQSEHGLRTTFSRVSDLAVRDDAVDIDCEVGEHQRCYSIGGGWFSCAPHGCHPYMAPMACASAHPTCPVGESMMYLATRLRDGHDGDTTLALLTAAFDSGDAEVSGDSLLLRSCTRTHIATIDVNALPGTAHALVLRLSAGHAITVDDP